MATLSFSLLLSKPTLNPTAAATCRLIPPSVSLPRPWNRRKTVTGGGTRAVVARGIDGDISSSSSYSTTTGGRRNSRGNGGEEEERETIMLPGCDYNHWLIVMEFPKDPSPTREQMIDTYLDTLESVLGSMEEAKRNMYAFSTTTYTGFQCTVSEETSEKFKGLPGVLWVLPDSYIDVKNKDYGGDKYINGEIIPCKYPTYQPKQSKSKYESKKYVRQRDGPAAADRRKPKQEVTPSESTTA